MVIMFVICDELSVVETGSVKGVLYLSKLNIFYHKIHTIQILLKRVGKIGCTLLTFTPIPKPNLSPLPHTNKIYINDPVRKEKLTYK